MTPNTVIQTFRVALLAVFVVSVAPRDALSQAGNKPTKRLPLSRADVAEIVALEKIEDRRDFDGAALQRIATSNHPELRRRAALAIARLYDPRGRALLASMRADRDTVVHATVVWATGQLVDTSAVDWIDGLLQSTTTPPGVATEAASAFGKIRTPDTRARLAKYLAGVKEGPSTRAAIGEALLSIAATAIALTLRPSLGG